MDLRDSNVVLLGGTGLVGMAIARRLIERGPARLVVSGLREEEAEEAVERLREEPGAGEVEIVPEHGDVFVRREDRGRSRSEILATPEGRGRLLDDLYGPLDEETYERSALAALLERYRPDVLVDCINTATAIAGRASRPTGPRSRPTSARSTCRS